MTERACRLLLLAGLLTILGGGELRADVVTSHTVVTVGGGSGGGTAIMDEITLEGGDLVSGGARIKADADGKLALTNLAGSTFTSLQFGCVGTGAFGFCPTIFKDVSDIYQVNFALNEGSGGYVAANGFRIPNAGVRFQAYDSSVAQTLRFNGGGYDTSSLFGGGAAVASASTITVTGNVFHVTGTTGISSVSGSGMGTGVEVTLIFNGIVTVTTGSGNLKLAGGVNMVTTADDTLTLIYDGTTWYEKCRSVN